MVKNARPRRTNSRYAKERELERIEDFLGEDFESLSQARAALSKETGHVPGKDSYKVRELSSRKNATVTQFIADLEDHAEEIDQLKRPQEFWAAEIYGNKTYSVFSSIRQLANKLASYRGLAEEHPRKSLKEIKILRVSGVNALGDYYKAKRLDVEDSWRRSKLKNKVDRARQRRQKKLIEGFKAREKSQKKRIKDLEKKLNEKK